MKLDAQCPTGVPEAVFQRQARVGFPVRPVHRLQEEGAKEEVFEGFRRNSALRKDQLQFIPGLEEEFGTGLRADANPIDPGGRNPGAIRLDGDFRATGVEGMNERDIELEKGLPACADDERTSLR